MNIAEDLFGNKRQCRSFKGDKKVIKFTFLDGSHITIQLPQTIRFMGQGAWDEYGNIINCSHDFEIEEYCPIQFSNGHWSLMDKNFEIVTTKYYEQIGLINEGHTCYQPPYYLIFDWNEEAHHTAYINGEIEILNKDELNKKSLETIDNYLDRINLLENPTIKDIILDCWDHLPKDNKREPWFHKDLKHGVALLSHQNVMDCYMAAYGEMHYKKCRAALQRIDFDTFGNFEIWDWGCGQGIASLTMIEILKEKDKLSFLRKITLVEPSPFTLNRAKENIKKLCPEVDILTINKYLPSVDNNNDDIKNITYITSNVIHLFSNILDIETVDLGKMAQIITQPYKSNYIMSIGPMNNNSYRLDIFSSFFVDSIPIYKIARYDFGYTSTHKKFGCKSICFKHAGGLLDFTQRLPINNSEGLKDDYDIRGQLRLSGLSEDIEALYSRITSSKDFNENDSIYIKPTIGGNEIDFAILRPNKGLLLIKVYEGEPELDKVKKIINDLDYIQKDIIRHHLENVWEKLIKKDKQIWKAVKKAILFKDKDCIEIYSWLENEKSKNIPETLSIKNWETVCGNKLCGFEYTRFVGKDALTTHPNAMQFGWFAPVYDNSSFDEITYRGILKILAPNWHNSTEGSGLVLDKIQEKLAEYPNNTRLINGVAGSGKTQILAQRAVNTQIATGEKILILSYNITLANYIKYRINQVKADFSLSSFQIASYHRFFKEEANKLSMRPTVISKSNGRSFDDEEDEDQDKEYSYDNIEFFKGSKTTKYSHIFIDEIQDFKPEWIEIIKEYFLVKDGEIVAFGDASQNIYHRPVNKNTGQIQVGLGTRWNNSLTKSHRFRNDKIADFVISFHNKFIGESEMRILNSQLDFEEFESLFYYPLFSIESLGKCCMDIINNKSLNLEDVVILSNRIELLQNLEDEISSIYGIYTKTTFATLRESSHTDYDSDSNNITRYRKIHFTMDSSTLKLSTVYSFKGWESKHIILIIDEKDSNSELIYTGLTRAKECIHVINLNNSLYDDFFRSKMSIVQ